MVMSKIGTSKSLLFLSEMLVVKVAEIARQFDNSLLSDVSHLLRAGLVFHQVRQSVNMQIGQDIIYRCRIINGIPGTCVWNLYREMQSPEQVRPPFGAQRNVVVHNLILSIQLNCSELNLYAENL